MVILKIKLGHEMRRLRTEVVPDFVALKSLVANSFGLIGREFTLSYEEALSGDYVRIANDADLKEASASAAKAARRPGHDGVLFLKVTVVGGAEPAKVEAPKVESPKFEPRSVPASSSTSSASSGSSASSSSSCQEQDLATRVKRALVEAFGSPSEAPYMAMLLPLVDAGLQLGRSLLAQVLPTVGPIVLRILDHPLVATALAMFNIPVDCLRALCKPSEPVACSSAAASSPAAAAPAAFQRPCFRGRGYHQSPMRFCPMRIVPADEAAFQPVRHNAICDNCQSRIVGVRFKCVNCPDYDLCNACIEYRKNVHDGAHEFKECRRIQDAYAAPAAAPAVEPVVSAPAEPVHLHSIAVDLKPAAAEPVEVTIEDALPEADVVPVAVVEEPKAEPEEKEKFKYEKEIKLLVGMGFEDTLRTRLVLLRFHGNIAATVDHLIAH